MRPIRFLILPLLATAMLATTPAAAQYRGPDPKVSLERLAPLAKLVGSWEGKGWALQRNGREEFGSTETVTSELDGTVLMVRGVHRDAKDGHVVHNALGLIAYDQAAQRPSFRTYLASGATGDYAMTITDKGFDWAIDTPVVKMRYTASITADRWIETGERSLDGGKSWTPFFAMELTKKK